MDIKKYQKRNERNEYIWVKELCYMKKELILHKNN